MFRERDADSVAQPVLKQRADADGALDPPVAPVPGLGDSDVERVAAAVGHAIRQARRQQAIGLDCNLGVARLHAEDDVVKALALAHVEELQRTLHHAGRRVAVAVQDAVRQRSVVGADANGAAAILAEAHQRQETLGDALDLLGVLRIGVLADSEPLLVGEVSGVDPHLLHVFRRDHGGVGREVDVGHQRNLDTAS